MSLVAGLYWLGALIEAQGWARLGGPGGPPEQRLLVGPLLMLIDFAVVTFAVGVLIWIAFGEQRGASHPLRAAWTGAKARFLPLAAVAAPLWAPRVLSLFLEDGSGSWPSYLSGLALGYVEAALTSFIGFAGSLVVGGALAPGEALRESLALTRGRRWRLFGYFGMTVFVSQLFYATVAPAVVMGLGLSGATVWDPWSVSILLLSPLAVVLGVFEVCLFGRMWSASPLVVDVFD